VGLEPGRARLLGDGFERQPGLVVVGRLTPVEGDGQALVLQPRPVLLGKRPQRLPPALRLRSQLESVDADVDDALDPDEPRASPPVRPLMHATSA
jgi:hypothetical protein